MAFTFELTSDAAPDVVLDAIAHRATYWRESQVPAELRSRGVFGVSGRVKHNTFYLACDNMGTNRSAHHCVATGVVDRSAVGGSVLRARIGMRQSARPSLTWVVFPSLLLSAVGASMFWIALVPFGVGAIFLLLHLRAEEKSFTPTDPLCAHLKARIETAVAEVSLPNARAAAETP
jgi:hypothetical protein